MESAAGGFAYVPAEARALIRRSAIMAAAAEGLDWVWEHRIDDLLKLGL